MINRNITFFGLYTAIFLIFGLVPNIGYISIGPIAFSTMVLPSTIMIIYKGNKGALFSLFMFGFTSIISAPYRSSLIINELGFWKAFITLFFSRILIFFPIYIYLNLTKKFKIHNYLNGFLISLIISIFNTIFVFSFFSIFNFKNKSFIAFFILFGFTNIIPEWLIIPFLGAIVGKIGYILKEKDESFKKSLYK